MAGLIRQGHFLGTKLRALRKRNGLTLDDLSARCVERDVQSAPSVSYLSMVETGKRMPSADTLQLLATVLGKQPDWFLDQNADVEVAPARRERGGLAAMPLEPAFLFSHDLLRNALPELLSQTGTSGAQFAQLLIRVWQESHHNDFPDIERAAEQAGGREMPLSLEALQGIARRQGLQVRWFDGDAGKAQRPILRSRFEAPGTVWINRRLRAQEPRLKYELAFAIGHKILHNGDGLLPPHRATQTDAPELAGAPVTVGMGAQDVLHAWRDFECSFFAGALLCPRIPFRRFLVRERHNVSAAMRLGVTPAVVMRRMTAVSPYRHWHFFDAYPPGMLRAVYRGNGIPLPWGNMSLVSDPCPRWAVFQMLRQPPEQMRSTRSRAARHSGGEPRSQISVMPEGGRVRLYCCHSMLTRDAADVNHVLSVGVDLLPALEAQGHDADAMARAIFDTCRRGGGEAPIPVATAAALRSVSEVLGIEWIATALTRSASMICPRSSGCPREPRGCPATHHAA
jgi:transcriptional regulator with XRE-family HTH domain